ncbi:MAG: glycosyltransferase family 9 protein [Pseudomonadota bacterium]
MKSTLPFSTPPKSLCLLRLSAIGDCTHLVPVVRTLQQHWPETKLTWIVGKTEAQLVGDIEGVEFIVFDKSRGWRAYADLKKQLAGRRFDALLHMQVAMRASLASLLVKAPIKLGYDKARAKDNQSLFTNARIAAVPRQHVLDSFFEFTRALGLEERELRWDIPIPPSARKSLSAKLGAPGRYLVINACTSNRARNWRNWRPERYAEVIDYAAEQYGLHCVLSGGPDAIETDMARAIEGHCRHKPANLVGKTGLKELLALLDGAELMISPDTGPAHMATTVDTPVIGLFASSNRFRTGPYLSLDWAVDAYPQALKDECGLSVEEAPWGKRVRHPEVMDFIQASSVCAMLDRFFRSTTTPATHQHPPRQS